MIKNIRNARIIFKMSKGWIIESSSEETQISVRFKSLIFKNIFQSNLDYLRFEKGLIRKIINLHIKLTILSELSSPLLDEHLTSLISFIRFVYLMRRSYKLF